MSLYARSVKGAANASSLTVTYAESALLDNTYGHWLFVSAYAAGGVTPSITSPDTTKWTKVGSTVTATDGTTTVVGAVFAARGDGAINGVSITAPSATSTRAMLYAVSGVTSNTFWSNVIPYTSNSSKPTSFDISATGSANDQVLVSTFGLSGTPGVSTGVSTPTGFTRIAGGQFESQAGFHQDDVDSAEAVSGTSSWTTANLVVGFTALLGGIAANPAPVLTTTDVGSFRRVTLSATNATGYSVSPTTNVVSLSSTDYLLPLPATGSVTYTFTATGAGGSDQKTVVVAASVNTSTVVRYVFNGTALV